MTVDGNPARVLHDLLAAANSSAPASSNEVFEVVWAKVFDAQEAELGRKLSAMLLLPDQVRRAMRSLRLRQDATEATLQRIEAGSFRKRVDRPWSEWWQAIDGNVALSVLALAAEILDRDLPTLKISDVDKLRQILIDLRSDVAGADDLPDDVRQVVDRYLSDLLDALDRLDTDGTRVFAVTVDALAGRVGVDANVDKALRSSKTGRVVLAFIAAVTIANGGSVKNSEPLDLPRPDPVVVECFNYQTQTLELEAPQQKELPAPDVEELEHGDDSK